MRTTWAAACAFAAACLLAPAALAGDDKPKDREPGAPGLAAGYVYPGAEPVGAPFDGPGVCAAKYATADGVGKVAAWYREKIAPEVGTEGVALNPGNTSGVRVGVVDDSRQPAAKEGKGGDARPAPVVLLVRKTNETVVTVAISRAEGEKLTHVALVVVDNKDR